MRKNRFCSAGLAVVATLAGTGVALAAQPPAKITAPIAASAPVAQHGVQVAIDPATGRVRTPTAADRQALGNQASSNRVGMTDRRPQNDAEAATTIKRNRAGRIGMSMQVPESQFNYLTAKINADGSVSIQHEGDDDSAAPQQEVTQ